MGYQLGIDVGTTYTAAAVCRSSDHRWVEPETVTLGTRSATVPSVIFVAPDGSVVVGEAAERRALTDPDRVVREFKRRIGDPTPIIVGGRAWAPEELSARLVRWVVDQVAEREGGPATRIALTHPASWGGHKKELLVAALAGQGLTVSFLAEPQAAALHYATEERVAPGSTIAVYDLGGGTFDAAVVRKADQSDAAFGAAGFGLLGRPEGLDHLGGVDFDEVVFDHVREGLPDAFADLDEADPGVLSAVARVRRECTEAKEALSADTEVSIPVLLPAARGSVRLHRSEFEGLIREQVEETVEALRRAVLSAGCAPEALTAVLLVGGSSRIPMVAQLVSERLGRPVAVDTDPKNAIAKGAALAISPKPTASWPEVAIPLVPAAVAASAGSGIAAGAVRDRSAAAGAVAGRPAASAAAPARPAGLVGVAGGMAAAMGAAPVAASAGRADLGRAPNPPREPARAPFSGAVAAPPQRPDVHSGPSVDEGDPGAAAPARRPVALLVGIGGLLAVAAIVLAAMLIPKLAASSSPGIVTESGTSSTTATTAPAAAPAPAPNAAPDGAGGNPDAGRAGAPTRPRSSGSGGGGTQGAPSNNNPGAPAPVTVAPAPPAPTTVPVPAPAPTSAAPAPTAGPTTAAAGTSPTTQAPGAATPVSTGAGGGSGAGGGAPAGTGSGGDVTPVGTGSGGGVTPVSTGVGGGTTPAGAGSGSGGKVTPVGAGSGAGSAPTEPTAAAPTVSA